MWKLLAAPYDTCQWSCIFDEKNKNRKYNNDLDLDFQQQTTSTQQQQTTKQQQYFKIANNKHQEHKRGWTEGRREGHRMALPVMEKGQGRAHGVLSNSTWSKSLIYCGENWWGGSRLWLFLKNMAKFFYGVLSNSTWSESLIYFYKPVFFNFANKNKRVVLKMIF